MEPRPPSPPAATTPKALPKSTAKPPATPARSHPNSTRCDNCQRERHGMIQPREAAMRDHMKESGYPKGRPGYVVDHIVPLSKGGRDVPSNMQWQTVQDAKAKDKVERR